MTYYHQFYNISAAQKNKIRNGAATIPDGYYNGFELDKIFQLLNAELTLHSPTGRLQLSTVKRLNLPVMLNSGLAKLLGFSQEIFQPGKEYIADKPHRLTVYRGICVHLAEASSSDNLHNGHPSTCGWSGDAKVLGKLPVLGRPTILITVGQGPTALAVGSGGGCLDIHFYSRLSFLFSFSLLLGDGPI